jgi:hypothetical protein
MASDAATIESRTSIDIDHRLFDGMPHISRAARAALPPPNPHRVLFEGSSSALVDAAVVATVRVLDPLAPGLSVTLVGLRLHVGRLCAPAGELVRLHVRFSVPV